MRLKTNYINEANLILKKEIYETVTNPLIEMKPKINKNTVSNIRNDALEKIYASGWNKKPILSSDSGISISGYREGVGLCFQTGNISRIYADLLKLQTLWVAGTIMVGVIVVPLKSNSILLGSNIVSYERLNNELKIFKRVITMPLCIIGFDGLEE